MVLKHTAITLDGLKIAVQEEGNPNGPELLFIHGISQSRLSWSRQTESSLKRDFRLVTYDLRGHGSSDKPLKPEYYQSGKAWADELHTVMDIARLKRPVLVGWSYGGLIIADYLKTYGADRLAGVAFIDTMIKLDASNAGPGNQWLGPMTSEDLATNIHATREFLRACFVKQPSQRDFETMLAFNMLTPPAVRKAMVTRAIDYDAVARELRLPTLVLHGERDNLILLSAARHTAATVPGARLSIYSGIGHSPFYEEAPRFNADLAAFVHSANARKRL